MQLLRVGSPCDSSCDSVGSFRRILKERTCRAVNLITKDIEEYTKVYVLRYIFTKFIPQDLTFRIIRRLFYTLYWYFVAKGLLIRLLLLPNGHRSRESFENRESTACTRAFCLIRWKIQETGYLTAGWYTARLYPTWVAFNAAVANSS